MVYQVALQALNHRFELQPTRIAEANERAMRFEHDLSQVTCRWRGGLDRLGATVRCDGPPRGTNLWLATRNHVEGLIEPHAAQKSCELRTPLGTNWAAR
jgi:hypothetical protein